MAALHKKCVVIANMRFMEMIRDRFDREICEGSEIAISKTVGTSSSILITGRVLEIRKIDKRTRLKIQQLDQEKSTWYDFSISRVIVID